jgi:hypothetical protein
MKQEFNKTEIEILFKQFLFNKASNDKDFEYCLTQSPYKLLLDIRHEQIKNYTEFKRRQPRGI